MPDAQPAQIAEQPAQRPVPVQTLHDSPRGKIYLSHGNNINWELKSLPGLAFHRTAAETRYLLTPLKLTVTSRRVLDRALKMIGSGVGLALESSTDVDDGTDYLLEAREFVRATHREALEFRYLGAASITTVVLAGLLGAASYFSLDPLLPQFLAAAALGGCGAMLSVAQRFRSIPIERYVGKRATIVAGCSRIVLGCGFGAVFLLFQKSELLLGFANGNPFMICSVAFIAGFSERLIPEMLEQLERGVVVRRVASGEAEPVRLADGAPAGAGPHA